LDGNQLTNDVLNNLWTMKSLKYLSLNSNDLFTGPIPDVEHEFIWLSLRDNSNLCKNLDENAPDKDKIRLFPNYAKKIQIQNLDITGNKNLHPDCLQWYAFNDLVMNVCGPGWTSEFSAAIKKKLEEKQRKVTKSTMFFDLMDLLKNQQIFSFKMEFKPEINFGIFF